MKVEQVIMPKNIKLLATLGENIRLARLRRKLTTEQVAERAGIGRKTLYSIELGSPSVSMGNYLQVLFVLGLQNDIVNIAANDTLGRKLQDAGMVINKRGAKRTQ